MTESTIANTAAVEILFQHYCRCRYTILALLPLERLFRHYCRWRDIISVLLPLERDYFGTTTAAEDILFRYYYCC
jgi:hypothetical protein